MKLIFLIFTSSLLISESSQFHPEEIIRWVEPTHLRMIEKLQADASSSQPTIPTTQPTNPTTTQPTNPTTTQPTNPTTTQPTNPTTTQPTTPTTTAKPTPPHCKPGQRKPVNGTCRDYLECDKTFAWVPKSCSTWCHNFNPQTSKCDWSWKYTCVDATSTVTPCTNKPSIITSTSPATIETTTKTVCTNGDTKPFQKGDCKDYLECDSNQWVKKTCSTFYDYDVNKKSCTFSLWAKCYE